MFFFTSFFMFSSLSFLLFSYLTRAGQDVSKGGRNCQGRGRGSKGNWGQHCAIHELIRNSAKASVYNTCVAAS